MPHRIILAGLFAAALPASAFAHGGHLGELTGHSHWIGAAALAAAALVAGLVAWKDHKKKASEDATKTDKDAEGDRNAEPEAAQ